MAVGFGASASHTYQTIAIRDLEADAAVASSDAAAIEVVVGDDTAARAAAVRLLGTGDARDAELATTGRLVAGAR